MNCKKPTFKLLIFFFFFNNSNFSFKLLKQLFRNYSTRKSVPPHLNKPQTTEKHKDLLFNKDHFPCECESHNPKSGRRHM